MQINPYLFYNGNCEAAFKFYEKVLGARIDAMLTHEGAPPGMPMPPNWSKKIMHAKISIDGGVIMASDTPPDHFHKPQGFSVSLPIEDPADAERKFKALSEGGNGYHAVRQDLLLQGIWHVRRSVRDSLDGQLPDGYVSALTCTRDRSPQVRARATTAGARSIRRGGESSCAPGRDKPPAPARTLPARPTAGRADPSIARREIQVSRGASRKCARSAPSLSTSVQADRQGPSITTRSPEARTRSNKSRNGPTWPPGLARMRTSPHAGAASAHSVSEENSFC